MSLPPPYRSEKYLTDRPPPITSQPRAQMDVGNPRNFGRPSGNFTYGLFEFEPCSIKTCLMGYFCGCINPCINFGLNAKDLDMPGGCPLWCCIGYFFPCVVSTITRANARSKFGIEGDGAEDCLIGCCCHACSIVQIAREFGRYT